MPWRVLAALALFVVIALATNGCSVIGFGVGAISDSTKPDSLTVPGWEVQTVKPGREIKLTLRNGEQLTGKFAGVDPVPQEQYAERYANFRDQRKEEVPLPALGEKINITLNSGVQGERELLGFDYQYVPAQAKKEESPSLMSLQCAISVRQSGDTTSARVLVSDIDRIVDDQGNVVQGKTLAKLASEGQIPFLCAVAIQDSTGHRQIAMEEVERIELKNRKHDKWKCAAIGAVFDVLLLIAAINFDLEFDFSGANVQ